MEGIIMLTGRAVLTIKVTTKYPTVPEIFVNKILGTVGYIIPILELLLLQKIAKLLSQI